MLEEHDEALAEIYAEHTGRPIQEMRDAMEAETWIRGSAAVDFGLADETGDDEDDANASAPRPLPEGYLKRCKGGETALNLFIFLDSDLKSFCHGNSPSSARFIPTPSANGDDHQNKTNSAGAPGGAIDRNQMDKIKALLKKHGIQFAEDASEDQLVALLDKIPTASTKNGDEKTIVLDPKLSSEIADMQKHLKEEKLLRVTARIDALIEEHRVTNDEREDAIERCMAEKDDKYLKILAKRPQAHAGAPALPFGIVEISAENPLKAIQAKHKTPFERKEAIKADFHELIMDAFRRDIKSGAIRADDYFGKKFIALVHAGINPMTDEHMPQLPLASNTYSATLVTSFLMDGSVTDLQNRWAMLSAFTLDTNPDPYKPKATGVLKHVTVGSTTGTNLTNFEAGDSTVAPVSVTMNQYTQPFQVSNSDLNSGLRMQNLVTINTANFANKVIEVATAPITAANFTGAVTTVPAAAFSFSDLASLQALLKKSPIKNLIIDGTYVARISNTPGFFQTAGTVGGSPYAWKAFGWDGIFQNTDWTGAGANVQGFACNPQAIAGIVGLPLIPPNIPGGILSTTVMTVDQLDIKVLVCMWFNPATRTMWTSYDVMAGFTALDTSAGYLVTSA
jgi:hypothetical protein